MLNRMNNDDKHRAGLELELRVVDKTAFSVASECGSPPARRRPTTPTIS